MYPFRWTFLVVTLNCSDYMQNYTMLQDKPSQKLTRHLRTVICMNDLQFQVSLFLWLEQLWLSISSQVEVRIIKSQVVLQHEIADLCFFLVLSPVIDDERWSNQLSLWTCTNPQNDRSGLQKKQRSGTHWDPNCFSLKFECNFLQRIRKNRNFN